MQRRLALVALLLSLLLLSACQTTSSIDIQPINQEPIRVNPVDVQETYINIQALEPQDHEITSGNLFANDGFESGLEGWTGCSAGAIKVSSDAYEGSGALEIIPNNCFYKSAEVSAGDNLILSCYAKITEGFSWTGMGLGFADSSWSTIDVDVPSTRITGINYARYDVKFTAPANSKYASMWFYSENKAVIDNCTLMLEQELPPPPSFSTDNLLNNGGFEEIIPTSLEGIPASWSIGCLNDNSPSAQDVISDFVRSRREGALVRFRLDGACLDQSLSASEISQLSGQAFTFSCYVNVGTYASMSIFLDGQAISTSSSNNNRGNFDLLEINSVVPQDVSSIFVSLYGNSALFDDCSLVVGNTRLPPPPTPSNNLLENANLVRSGLTGIPIDWNLGCGGSVSGTLGNFTLLSDGCLDQALDSNDLSALAGKQYTLSCQGGSGGYSAISIFFDGVPVSKAFSERGSNGLIELKGIAPSASTGFVSIYTESAATILNCYLRFALN